MAPKTPFRITPSLGPDLWQHEVTYYWDTISAPVGVAGQPPVSYQLGSAVVGNDGHTYVFVRASAAIAATAGTGTQVTITEPAFTVATGTGGYYTPPGVAIASGEAFHVRRGVAGAP